MERRMAEIKAFCLHHTGVPQRKERLLGVFDHQSIDVEWVESYHPSEIDMSALDIRHDLNVNEVSLYLKHKYCFEQQKEKGYENILIFEDDIIIPEQLDFHRYLSIIEEQFSAIDGDIIFIGECCNIRPPATSPEQLVYYHPSYRARCTHCFLVNIKCVDKILEKINILDDAIDWKLNHTIEQQSLRCCYAHPGLLQTTDAGQEKSTIQEHMK